MPPSDPHRAPRARIPPGLGVVLACWGTQQLPALPAGDVETWLALCGALLLAATLLPLRRQRLGERFGPVLAAALLASGWALSCAREGVSARLDPEIEGRTLRVVGVVADMPQFGAQGARFAFRIESCAGEVPACPEGRLVRLAWQLPAEGARPVPGQRWRFEIRLKRPHALLNPGLFDAELRALEEGIVATGGVRVGKSAPAPELETGFVAGFATIVAWCRDRLRDAMLRALPADAGVAGGVLVALAVGDQGAIPSEWWARFNRTGVGHLMSISGLHITMLAALGGGLAGRLWSSRGLAARMRRPLPGRIPTPYVRWAAGIAFGFGYALLAGWGIPAQRTCWMLAAAGLALLSGRARSTIAVLSTAGAVVCVLDPWAPMAAGFWLSFAAVGAIIWHGSARGGRGAVDRSGRVARLRATLHEALRSQVAATVSLLPLGAIFFASVSLVGPIANAFAIPLVSAVVTPLALAGAVFAPLSTTLGGLPLTLGAWLTDALLWGLRLLDLGYLSAPTVGTPGPIALALAVVGCAIVLAPVPLPGRRLALFALAPMLLAPPARPGDDELWLTALDIGQGTAVLVETSAGRLLYDTGPAMGPAGDAGGRVIAPYLRARGIPRLEAMVVSHEDADHAGGALSVLQEIDTAWVASSLPAGHPIVATANTHSPCRRGESWHWGRVRFDWLHPGDDDPVPKRSPTNARSCVLRIDSPAGTALLAGDIEAPQERRLAALVGEDALRADLLLVPHHGSKTSSTEAFLDAVRPRLAVFQVGYRNRYRHPHPAVMQRYVDRGIRVLRSDAHAAIEVRMREGEAPRVWRQRVDAPRYWRIRLDGLEGPADDREVDAPEAARSTDPRE